MPRSSDPSSENTQTPDEHGAGPRAVLRVPEVLLALAASPDGSSLAELSPQLGVPKTSLHRLLRTLERGGYLTSQGGLYRLGPASFHLGSQIGRAAPSSAFPACARPTLEWLAQESEETVMLGILSGDEPEILYVDVIDSAAPIRFSLSIGDRRPLYCAASGEAVLAFLSLEAQRDYAKRTDFIAFTPRTTREEALADVLNAVRASGVAFDNGGRVLGASGVASPIFDAAGNAFGSISVAGPSERIEAGRKRFEAMVLTAAERVSRLLGYGGSYPPDA